MNSIELYFVSAFIMVHKMFRKTKYFSSAHRFKIQTEDAESNLTMVVPFELNDPQCESYTIKSQC